MGIALGASPIAAAHLGGQELTKIYLGAVEVFSAGYDPIQDFANGEQGFIYDIQDLSTLFQDTADTIPAVVGQPVARILDKSGNGNHATQVSPTSRAILRFVDGKYWLQPDGTDDWYITPTITPGTDKAQVIVGIRKLSDASYGGICELSQNADANAGGLAFFGANIPGFYMSTGAIGNRSVTSGSIPTAAIAAPVTSTMLVAYDRAINTTAEISYSHNGAAMTSAGVGMQGTTALGNFGAFPVYLFRRGGLTLPLSGLISSMVLRFGPNLTPEQIANMNAWANERAGAYL